METMIEHIRQALLEKRDEKTLATSERFFKKGEAAKIHGVRMPEVGKIGKQNFRIIKEWPKEKIFGLCGEFWKSGYLEEAVVACVWTELLTDRFEPEDFVYFEHWVQNHVNNWMDCDTLCNHTVGNFVMKYPEFIPKLKEWATSSHRWTKCAAAVTLIIPARKGLFLADILEIADILLKDPDDLVQKGYGWMLKAASQAWPQEIFEYVVSKKSTMPRTAYRYAIEKLPALLRAEAMKK